MKRTRLLAAGALCLAAVAAPGAVQAAPAAPAPTGSTTVIANCVDHRVEPKQVIIACGDGGLFLGVKRYRYWSATSAVGYGAIRQNGCDPNCAEGTYSYTKARIRFYHARPTSQGEVFTRALATYHLHGKVAHEVFYLLRKPITSE